ncbi:MAG TPA: HK97 family phage prohead protease, partial [Phycisphaerae bacterium]|nr:HK97 family phage prohead protease [Phycisphaerae bacterium]
MARLRELRMPTQEEYRAHGDPPFAHVRAEGFEIANIDDEAHAVEGYVATDQWARDGMRILPQAWARKLDTYRANPVVTFAHSWWEIPPGLATEVRVDDDRGLWARLEFDVEDEMGGPIWRAIKTKRLRTTSVAWPEGQAEEFGGLAARPDGSQGFEWRDNITLMEISVVPMPSDTDAVFTLARSMGLNISRGVLDEIQIAEQDLAEIARRSTALDNIIRHWRGEGRAPSPEVVSAALSTVGVLVSCVREGRVLSAANRTLVDQAVEALAALQAADDESRDGRTAGEQDAQDRQDGSGRDPEHPAH